MSFAAFHSTRKVLVISDVLMRWVKGADNSSAESFIKPGGRLSMPVSLFFLIDLSSCSTSWFDTFLNINFLSVFVVKLGCFLHVKLHNGNAFSFKVATMLAKKEQNAFAIMIGSLTSLPLILKV